MKCGIQLRCWTIQIDEAYTHAFDGCVRLQRADTLHDECLETLYECKVVHPSPVSVSRWVTTHIVDNYIDRFETCAAAAYLLCRFDCRRKDGTAYPPCIGEALELGCDRTKVAADVMSRVELSPFLKGRRVLGVKAFQAEIETSDGGREVVGERVTDGSVGACFGFVVSAVELAERRQSSCKGGKVGGRADHVPSTLEDESLSA